MTGITSHVDLGEHKQYILKQILNLFWKITLLKYFSLATANFRETSKLHNLNFSVINKFVISKDLLMSI